MRLDLRDGQWAELRERITHGAHKRIKLAIRKGNEDDAAAIELDDILIREFVTEWHIRDLAGELVPLTDADATDRIPSDIADVLWRAAVDLQQGATTPKSPTAS